MPAKSRGSVSASIGDAVRAVSVIAGLIIAVAVFFSFGREDVDPVPPAVDYASVVQYLRGEYPYAVAMPDVPDGWRATSVDHAVDAGGNWWRVGFVVEGESFVGLQQADGEVNSLIDDELNDYAPDGTSTIAGEQWEQLRRDGRVSDFALVNVSDDGVATIVYGSEPYEELEEFVLSLDRGALN
jgi:hypothetical protein